MYVGVLVSLPVAVFFYFIIIITTTTTTYTTTTTTTTTTTNTVIINAAATAVICEFYKLTAVMCANKAQLVSEPHSVIALHNNVLELK